MALMVSVSGLRGIVGEELTPDLVLRYAASFAATIGPGRYAVGRDSRPSGDAMHHAVIAGLAGAGCAVDDMGILPTPTLGLLVRELNCVGGIQITASHNPAPYNGLKLFGSDGAVLSAAQGEAIQSRFRDGSFGWSDWSAHQRLATLSRPWEQHAERVLQLVDGDAIRQARFRIVLDANGGAGGPLGMHLLQTLGCQVIPVACEPDGQFRHEPEPLPEHLHAIEEVVRQHPGAIGAALDPDADRLVLIDESGQCLHEEWTLALAVRQRLISHRGPVVINLSTSRTTEDVAKAAGAAVHRSAVGEANVVAKMREVGAIVGGEGNGGVIDPRVGWVRDPFIGVGLILESMSKGNSTLQRLAAGLPRYAMRKEKFTISRHRLPQALQQLKMAWSDATIDETDGIRFEWPDSWLHIRASNTEPIVRVIAEATTGDRLDRLCRLAGHSIMAE